MKKIINLIKNGEVYAVGSVTEEEYNNLVNAVQTNTTNIEALNSNTYTKQEVDKAIEDAINGIDNGLFLIVNELPPNNIDVNKIYLVPSSAEDERNVYIEYVFANDDWEKIGSITIDEGNINLTNYITKDEFNQLINNVSETVLLTQLQYNQIQNPNPSTVYLIYKTFI